MLVSLCSEEVPSAADIGSGTGIFSKMLLSRGVDVYSVEPNDDMRTAAEISLGDFEGFVSVKAAAENTTLNSASVDFITAAQSFHWFDVKLFKQECLRIIKPGGFAALIWNTRDMTSPLIQGNREICAHYCRDFEALQSNFDGNADDIEYFYSPRSYELHVFKNPVFMDKTSFVGRNLSSSYAPKPEDVNYSRFVKALGKLFDRYEKNGEIIFSYITKMYVGTIE